MVGRLDVKACYLLIELLAAGPRRLGGSNRISMTASADSTAEYQLPWCVTHGAIPAVLDW
jgi:hypothetical protein